MFITIICLLHYYNYIYYIIIIMLIKNIIKQYYPKLINYNKFG